ncbi:hypothetical protein I4F81_010690 [Pyropia yezoensis]|uniref:Uncharacterized protein n=1 Tax=Pyropia yezoensis TaxID=2788 RepID=A0ACC3CDW9_PYRYE|nr:hypothetical protein I4F81_010690 [Neopyropia yezoensis]
MAVLASRDRTCVHPSLTRLPGGGGGGGGGGGRGRGGRAAERAAAAASFAAGGFDVAAAAGPSRAASGSLAEECRTLVNADGCGFHRRADAVAAAVPAVHDIEELVAVGREVRGCPYFAARTLMTTADLVLCPYSYLADPLVRAAMAIDLDGAVVIIDEAHNIEDVCREGASLDTSAPVLAAAADTLRSAVVPLQRQPTVVAALTAVATALTRLAAWTDAVAAGGRLAPRPGDGRRAVRVWPAAELPPLLDHLGISEASMGALTHHLSVLRADALGEALVDWATVIPAGVLVFLPSYRLLSQLTARWAATGVWARLCGAKSAVLVEPSAASVREAAGGGGGGGDGGGGAAATAASAYEAVARAYAAAVAGGGGALLFAVYRGKVSEGMDFKDDLARGVVLVGVPYPAAMDLNLQRKQQRTER